jgi:hypothetical protein
MVAKQFGTEAREVVVTAGMVRKLLTRAMDFLDEPYADGSAIPTYFVCERAKGEVVVVLSGEGGDEIFAGYETHAAYKASRLFARVPRAIRRGVIAPVVHALPVSHKKLSLEFKMKRFLGGQGLPPQAAHLWWRIVLTDAQKHSLYAPGVAERIALEAPLRHFDEAYTRCRAKDTLNRLLCVDSSVFLPDDLMIKNDRMSMAHSLEARVPMTDPDLAEYMSRVPARLKLPGMRKKHIMRKRWRESCRPRSSTRRRSGSRCPTRAGSAASYATWWTTTSARARRVHPAVPPRGGERAGEGAHGSPPRPRPRAVGAPPVHDLARQAHRAMSARVVRRRPRRGGTHPRRGLTRARCVRPRAVPLRSSSARAPRAAMSAGASALRRLHLAGGPVEHDAVLGRALGGEQRLVGGAPQLGLVAGMLGEHSDADAHRDPYAMRAPVETLELHALALDDHAQSLGDRHHVLGVDRRGEQHRELLATPARDGVERAHAALQGLRHVGQHLVAGLVAVGGVELLKSSMSTMASAIEEFSRSARAISFCTSRSK